MFVDIDFLLFSYSLNNLFLTNFSKKNIRHDPVHIYYNRVCCMNYRNLTFWN